MNTVKRRDSTNAMSLDNQDQNSTETSIVLYSTDKNASNTNSSITTSIPVIPTLNIDTESIFNSNTTKNINNSMKAMKTLLILLLGFYVCWLPLIVYFLTFATKTYNNLTIYILMFIACCNAVIDPLVYSFRS